MSATDFNSSQPVRTESNGDIAAKIVDGTVPSQALGVDSAGRVTVKLDDGAGNVISSQTNGTQRALDVGIDVAGVQIDPRQVRTLTAADIVTAAQGAPNTIANAWTVKPTDGTNSQAYTAASEAKVSVTQPLPAGTNIIGSVKLDDGSGTPITSTAINAKQTLDANLPSSGVNGSAVPYGINLIAGSDGTNARSISTDANGKVKVDLNDASGNPFSATNPLPVLLSATVPGTAVNNYSASLTNVAAGSSDLHTYTITAGKTFLGKKWIMSASGRARFDIQVSTNGTTFNTIATVWTTASCPTQQVDMGQLAIADAGTGAAVQVVRINEDKQPFGLYSSICGVEQ